MDAPLPHLHALPTIHTWSIESCGIHLGNSLSTNTMANEASTAFPAANHIIYIPFALAAPTTVRKLWWYNGTIGGGSPNNEMGIYDEHFVRLITTGSTAATGASVLQIVDVTDTLLGPGEYYMAITSSGTPGFFAVSHTLAQSVQMMGIMGEQPGGFGLPAVGTPIAPIYLVIPMIGLSTVTGI